MRYISSSSDLLRHFWHAAAANPSSVCCSTRSAGTVGKCCLISLMQTATTGVAEQEAVKLDKQKGFELLARCSKAISDATYLDEIGKNHRFYEKLSSADKREINQRALVYAEQVLAALLLDVLQAVDAVWMTAFCNIISLGDALPPPRPVCTYFMA